MDSKTSEEKVWGTIIFYKVIYPERRRKIRKKRCLQSKEWFLGSPSLRYMYIWRLLSP